MAEDFSDKNKDYGLPNVEPHPINRDQPGIISDPPKMEPPKEGNKDNKLIIIVLSVVGALILASLLYMFFWDSDDVLPEAPVVEDRVVLDPQETGNDPEDEGRDPENSQFLEEEAVINDEPGSIDTISVRTNRYFIFVGSYKFRAYAHRHAERLAADGFAVKLVIPDDWVGMRVAVGNYASSDEASLDARQIRSRYGIEVVISKY